MSCLVDTNILVYAAVAESPFHSLARTRLQELRVRGELLVVTNQVLREYVAVVTRPTVLARPRSVRDSISDVREFQRVFRVVPDPPDALEFWALLVEESGVTGAAVHDAFLVATAICAGVGAVVTNNPRHFERFRGIVVLPLEPETA